MFVDEDPYPQLGSPPELMNLIPLSTHPWPVRRVASSYSLPAVDTKRPGPIDLHPDSHRPSWA
jgi:hypothetical protein